MNASDFNRLLNTDHYSPADLEEVEKVCRNYPEFGLAHMLRVRVREALHYDKEEALRLAAVHSGDRRRLYEMVSQVNRLVEETQKEEEESTGIVFSGEANEEAEVIIEQHAPYMPKQEGEELLELDDDPSVADGAKKTDFMLDEEQETELNPATAMEGVAKEDAEMENPSLEEGTVPSADNDMPSVPDGKHSGRNLIQNFIEEDPGPIRADSAVSSRRDFSQSSIREHDGFITDTLAQIYVKQGLYAKAIYAYEKLSLKYPEKSAYFAAQIEKIRNINHS